MKLTKKYINKKINQALNNKLDIETYSYIKRIIMICPFNYKTCTDNCALYTKGLSSGDGCALVATPKLIESLIVTVENQ